MKRLLAFTLSAIAFILCLSSCAYIKHEHTEGPWQYDNLNHWKNIECARKKCDFAPQKERHSDLNHDHVCDVCDGEIAHEHITAKWDQTVNYHSASIICTWDECYEEPRLDWHIDENYDAVCDVCSYARNSGDYSGEPLSSIFYTSVDYMGGFMDYYLIDFEGNTVTTWDFNPMTDTESERKTIKEFSEAEEKALINKLYSCGFFDIAKSYPDPQDVLDGGGWALDIEFEGGKLKSSAGSNNSPGQVFSNSAKAFYDLCEHGIVAYVPTIYYRPPHNIDYTFKGQGYFSYGVMTDYRWNGFESLGHDIFEINEGMKTNMKFYNNVPGFVLSIGTQNYDHLSGCERFTSFTIRSYDYNEDMTNEALVHSGGWFYRSLKIELEPDKIYVLRYEYENGDYFEVTFNTRTWNY